MAKPFSTEMEIAFFVVNFGYSKRDYLELTETEKLFIYKEFENRTVKNSTLLRDAVFNAVINANRKKGKSFKKLWKKREQRADREVIQNNIETIREIEKNEKGWIEKIYEANGIRIPDKKQKGAINNG